MPPAAPPEDNAQIQQQIDQLRAHLGEAEAVPDTLADEIGALLGAVEDHLQREAAPPSPAALREAALAFESAHPALTSALNRLSQALSDLGI